jgi:hypothetical protein
MLKSMLMGRKGKLGSAIWIRSISIRMAAEQSVIQQLESRLLMSVTASTLYGPDLREGTTLAYVDLYNGAPVTNGVTDTSAVVKGTTTYAGNTAVEVDITSNSVTPPTEDGGTPTYDTSVAKGFFGYTSQGLVTYGETVDSVTGKTVYTPAAVQLPPVMVAGQAYPSSYSTTATFINSSGGMVTATYQDDLVNTLVSETTVPITVPAGTFDCYEVDQSDTTTHTDPASTSTQVNRNWFNPSVGLVKSEDGDPDNLYDTELKGQTHPAYSLSFQTQPSEATKGNAVKPPITVEILDSKGAKVTTGPDSAAAVTLALASGSGTLGGTLTVSAVGGVATFSDISIAQPGQYTIKATSPSIETPVTSSSFAVVEGSTSTVTPVLSRLKVPVSAVSDSAVNASATVTLTNGTGSTVSGKQSVTTYLSTTPTLTNAAIQVGNPVNKTVNLKAGKSTAVTVKITKLPQVPAQGDYYLLFKVSDAAGDSTVVASTSTIAVGPAQVTLTPTVNAVNLPASVVSGGTAKGTVTLSIVNTGNVVSKGMTTIVLSASAVAGTPGTTIATLSKNLSIGVGKTIKVVVPIKAIPVLADGSYFIVAQVTDPLAGNVSIASSAGTTGVAAPFVSLIASLGSAVQGNDSALLTVANHGNVDDTTTLHYTVGFALDAAGQQPAGGTKTVVTGNLHIKAGKSMSIHPNAWKSIVSGLVSGTAYYLTVSVEDSSGNQAVAVSSTSFTA